jgi:O-methyltransferase
MLSRSKNIIRKIIRKLGYQIVPIPVTAPLEEFPRDMETEFRAIYVKSKNCTMTSQERMYALYQAVKYVSQAKVPGDFVECGVWKGGSAMLMAHTLLGLNETGRKIYLYDTFTGMPEPTVKDQEIKSGQPALDIWKVNQRKDHNEFCYASLSEVKNNLRSTNYPQDDLVFVQGKVEDTIPGIRPKQIAILRLDTDWFASTDHELRNLFPLVSKGGVVIIDDYGYWSGAKEAVDKYFAEFNIPLLLNRIDYTGRMGIKV